MAATLKTALLKNLKELRKLSPEKLMDLRYKKFRAMGVFGEDDKK